MAYPARTATGKHGQLAIALEPLDKFIGFFHNCKVRRAVDVENLLEAEISQRRINLALNVGSKRLIEIFA